jgi:CBS domain-containing protein
MQQLERYHLLHLQFNLIVIYNNINWLQPKNNMSPAATTVGQLMTEKLETINPSDTAQEAAKKMRDKKVSSLVITDREDRPIGIVTERDLVRQVCTKDVNSNAVIVHHIMSSPLVTIDANSSAEVAADIMIQNKVRHLLVMDENKVLGIITPSDFTGYLKENLNLDDVNARILQSLKEEEDK